MSSQEGTNSPSDFLVCQSEDCHQPTSICHRAQFKDMHHDVVSNKKVSHKSVSLRDSLQYLNFTSIYRLNYILSRKIGEVVKPLQCNVQSVVQSSLYTSPTFRELFNNSDHAISQYFYLCQLHQGNTMGKIEYFSSDFCTAISMPNQRIINKLYKELCSYTPEWQNLNLEFNYASGINSNYLEAFITQQVQYLADYINKVGDKFDIKEYITLRNSRKQYTNDPYYYTHEFTTFLVQKYQKNAAEQTIFNLMEYYLNFWQYFFVVLDTNKNAVKYFEEQMSFYKEYEQYSEQQKLTQSFLAYRMWRINRKTSTYFPSLRNPYFFETFIYSFIQYLIQKKLFSPDQQRNYDFRVFASFLQDYVKYVIEKGEEFTFIRYGEYYEFRKITEKLEQNLKKNKEIVYDKKFFLEYAHNEFTEGNKLAIKKYKKYQQKRAAQEDQKIRQFREQTQRLRAELVEAQKQRFYEVVFNNFITEVAAPKSSLKLNRESYQLFKNTLLSKFDESYIQSIEAEYRLSLTEQVQEGEQVKKKTEGSKEKVKEEINADEEQLAQLINEEQKSEADSSQEENELVQNCPCCKGKPYECEQPDCRILGCCSACMLDY